VEWVKQHPYLTGVGVLVAVILYFVLRSSGTSSASNAAAVASQNAAYSLQQDQIQAAQQSQTEQYNAALEALALQNQGAVQVAQIAADANNRQTAAALTLGLAQNSGTVATTTQAEQDQLAALYSQYGASMDIAGLQAGVTNNQTAAGVTEAQIASDTTKSVTGTQAQVADTQLADALAAQKLSDAASIQINSNNTKAAVTQAQINAGTTLAQAQLQSGVTLAGINASQAINQSNNDTALKINAQNGQTGVTEAQISEEQAIQLAGINAGVTQASITAAQNLYETLAADQTQVDLQGQADEVIANVNQTNVQNNIIAAITSGQFNKGGAGGANQVAALSALTGNQAPGVAAEQGNAAASSSFWQSLFSAIGTIGKGATAAIP